MHFILFFLTKKTTTIIIIFVFFYLKPERNDVNYEHLKEEKENVALNFLSKNEKNGKFRDFFENGHQKQARKYTNYICPLEDEIIKQEIPNEFKDDYRKKGEYYSWDWNLNVSLRGL